MADDEIEPEGVPVDDGDPTLDEVWAEITKTQQLYAARVNDGLRTLIQTLGQLASDVATLFASLKLAPPSPVPVQPTPVPTPAPVFPDRPATTNRCQVTDPKGREGYHCDLTAGHRSMDPEDHYMFDTRDGADKWISWSDWSA